MRRRLLYAALGVAATAAGCSSSARAPSPPEAAHPTVTVPAATATTVDANETYDPAAAGATAPPAAASAPAADRAACRAGDPLANVYHPYRLHVVRACLTVTGTVVAVRHEQDGDIHFNVRLDPADAGLVNDRNVSEEGGALVAEIVPADEPGCSPGQPPRPASGTYDYGTCTGADETAPSLGARVSVTGPYVLDADHGWMEVHPAWSVTTLGPAGGAPAPVGATPAPGAGTTSAPAPAATPGGSVRITSAPASVAPGGTASLTAEVPAGATCSLGVTLPSGAESQSSGLGAESAGGDGRLQWTWKIGTRTRPGTATATVSCAGGSAGVQFQIT